MEQNSWQQNIRGSIKHSTELEQFLDRPVPEVSLYPLLMPRSFAQKIAQESHQGPLSKQFVPSLLETDAEIQRDGFSDPIGDELRSQGGGIIHRYGNRILFTPTSVCPINCRYCFRKNELGVQDFFRPNLQKLTSYLQEHPQINEVILTGGDPLVLNESKLQQCFEAIASAENIRYVRIHTRTPVVMPERITHQFLQLLKQQTQRFNIVLALHTNHISELDANVREAMAALSNIGITLLSQTVLLKGVNDQTETLAQLFEGLAQMNIRPYYLHHPDQVKGAMHFYLDQEQGFKIYQGLRQRLPGWMIPHYVVDSPEASGKRLVATNIRANYSVENFTLGC